MNKCKSKQTSEEVKRQRLESFKECNKAFTRAINLVKAGLNSNK
jgi:hypothetical protein